MNIVQCPNYNFGIVAKNKSIFIAGGISNCPDWQSDVVKQLKPVLSDDCTLINPRRSDFDASNPAESEFQIDWEFDHLRLADIVLFWFPMETLCPITLYELGVCAERGTPLIVGCHPNYARKFDIEHQLALLRPSVQVRDNIESVLRDLQSWVI